MSEGHQRQLLLFGQKPGKYMDEFSREFKTCYLDLLRRRFGGRRVHANVVYQEYIRDKEHIHMNSTKWVTLTGFCQYLGREGLCKVEETEKGWFIQYIDRDPKAIARQLAMQNKDKIEKNDDDRMLSAINKQIKKAEKAGTSKQEEEPKATELLRDPNDSAPLKFNLGLAKPPVEQSSGSTNFTKPQNVFAKLKPNFSDTASVSGSVFSQASKRSALDEIKEEEERFKEKRQRKSHWLTENIVVRLVGKKLPRELLDRKAVVYRVMDRFGAKLELLPTASSKEDRAAEDRLPSIMDQGDLETVVPGKGRRVRVVNGAYRGSTALVKDINMDECTVTIEIDAGPLRGRCVDHVIFEDVCKLHE